MRSRRKIAIGDKKENAMMANVVSWLIVDRVIPAQRPGMVTVICRNKLTDDQFYQIEWIGTGPHPKPKDGTADENAKPDPLAVNVYEERGGELARTPENQLTLTVREEWSLAKVQPGDWIAYKSASDE
jgi:hypothetical protein